VSKLHDNRCIDDEEKSYPHIYIEENGSYMKKYLSRFENMDLLLTNHLWDILPSYALSLE
jgi:hypothetical protein